MNFIPEFKLIREDVGVFLFYAGKDRKYFEETRRRASLFLDLPGFVANDRTFDDDADIVRSVHRARATRRFINNPTENPRPMAVSEYSPAIPRHGKRVDRAFLADVINARILFAEMKPGDLVILTPGNHYDPILLGEVKSVWNSAQIVEPEEFKGFTTPYREVGWVPHGLARSDFAREVARHMQNRRAVTHIDPRYYENIFRLIYARYIWGNVSKLDVYSETYESNDPTATFESSFLIKYAVALYVATLRGEVERFTSMDKDVAANEYYDSAVVDQMIQSFGSPGGYVARLIGASAAVFVAGVIAVALSDESQSVTHIADQVAVEATSKAQNSGAAGEFDPFADSLRAGTDDELRQKYGRQARAKLGLTLNGHTPPEIRARQMHDES